MPNLRLQRMRRRLLGATSTLVVLAGAVPGATADTLVEALAAAYNNNPQLLAQRARLRATDEQVPQALAGWRPTVSLNGTAGVARDEPNTGDSDTLQPRSLGLSLSQPVYRGGRTVASTERAENLVRAERARTIATEQGVLLDAVRAYMNVLRDQAVLDLSVNNEQVLRRQLEAARDRFRVGEITRTDVSQAEARLARSTADRVQAEGNLAASRANYERVVGELPGRLELPDVVPPLPMARPDAAALAATNNPSVIAAEYTAAAASDTVRVVRGELLPEVRVVGEVARDEETSQADRRTDRASVTARLTVPLYEAGSVYSRTREANQTVAQRRNETDDVRRQAVEAATRSWETLEAFRARRSSLEANIRAAEIALEGVQQEAAVGSRTVLDILDAEQELFTARVEEVRVRRDEIVAVFELASAIGTLTAHDLKLPVQLYDLEEYYRAVRNKWIGFGPKD